TGGALLLGLGDHRQGEGGLAGGFRPVDLHHAPLGQAADTEGDIEAQGSGGNTGYGQLLPVAHAPHGALAKLAFDLAEGGLQCFFLLGVHWIPLSVTWRSVMAPARRAGQVERSIAQKFYTVQLYSIATQTDQALQGGKHRL